jgi:hypothetical protein
MVTTVPTSDNSLISGVKQGQNLGVTEMASSTPNEEPVLTASLGKIFSSVGETKKVKKVLKDAAKPTDQGIITPLSTADDNLRVITPDSDEYLNSVNIDYSKINSAEDFEKVFADINSNVIYKKKDVQPFDEVKELAKLLDVQDILINQNGFKNAQEVYAARNFVKKSGNDLVKLAEEVIADPTNTKLLINFKKHLTIHTLYVDKFIKGKSDVGRALNAFRIPTMADPKDQAGAVDSIVSALGGSDNIITIAEKTKELFEKDGLPAVNKFIGLGKLKRADAAWREAYRGGLLFSVKTQLRNILGNNLYALYSVPEYVVAGLYGTLENTVVKGLRIDKGLNKLTRGKYWGDYKNGMTWEMGMARMYGLIEGSKDAFLLAKKSLQTGATSDNMTKYEGATGLDAITAKNLGLKDSSALGSTVNFMGKVYRLPYKGLTAGDEFYKEIARSMEIHTLVMEQATIIKRTQNLSWEASLKQATEEIMSNPAKYQKQLDEAALYYTFQDKLPGYVDKMVTGIQEVPFVGTVILPFAKTPVNITRRFLDLTLGGIVDKRVLTDPKYRSKVVARIGMASTFAIAISSYFQEGRITGGYPLTANGEIDMNMKAALDAVGWRPYSFVFAGDDFPEGKPLFENGDQTKPNGTLVYRAYNGLEPVGAVIGVIAHANELMARSKDPEIREGIADAAGVSFLQYMSEMPMIKGMSDTIEILDSLKFTSIVDKNLNGMISAPIAPLAVTTGIGNIFDDVRRDVSPDFTRDMKIKNEDNSPNLNFGNGKGKFYNFLIETFNRNLYRMPFDDIYSLGEMYHGFDTTGKKLPPKYDIFGNVLTKSSGRGLITEISNTFINPFTTYEVEKKGTYVYENLRLGSPIKNRKPMIYGIRLRPVEYADWINLSKNSRYKEFGMRTFEEYINYVLSPGSREYIEYLGMNNNEKYQYLQKINTKAFELGKTELKIKYPELGLALETIKDLQNQGDLPIPGANLQ